MADRWDMRDAAGVIAGRAKGDGSAAEAALEAKIARERADLLYASALPMVIALVLAAALTVLLWGELPDWALLGWLALIAAAALSRWSLRRAYQAQTREPAQAWLDRFAWHVLGFGLAWSLSGVVVWIDQSPLTQGLVIL